MVNRNNNTHYRDCGTFMADFTENKKNWRSLVDIGPSSSRIRGGRVTHCKVEGLPGLPSGDGSYPDCVRACKIAFNTRVHKDDLEIRIITLCILYTSAIEQ